MPDDNLKKKTRDRGFFANRLERAREDLLNYDDYLVFLGTSASKPQKKRACSSIYFKIKDKRFLIDAGENFQRTLLSLEIGFELDFICLTHKHYDHIGGLIGYLSSQSLYDRKNPLTVYGPKIIETLKKFLEELAINISYPLKWVLVEKDQKIEFENFSLKTFEMDHSCYNLAYLIELKPVFRFNRLLSQELRLEDQEKKLISKGLDIIKDGNLIKSTLVNSLVEDSLKILVTGDTRPINCKNIDSDIVITECTYFRDQKLADLKKHTSLYNNRDLTDFKKYYNFETIILTHINEEFSTKIGDKLKEIFKKKNIFFAYDLATINISHNNKNLKNKIFENILKNLL